MRVVLSIAGSDSGGGAGIQADIRSIQQTGMFACTAITAVTAQNLQGVRDVHGLDATSIRLQMEAIFEGFSVQAGKTGMLWSESIVREVARTWPKELPLVVDPVMVASSGARLMDEAAIEAYRQELFPIATLVTPNLDEAEVLCPGSSSMPPIEAAEILRDKLGCAVLLKGGHRLGPIVDVLASSEGCWSYSHSRVEKGNTHGSGCILSAALSSRLAQLSDLPRACHEAISFVHQAITLSQGGLAAIERSTLSLSKIKMERIAQ